MKPPPIAHPLTAAISGLPSVMFQNGSYGSPGANPGVPRSAASTKSSPAQNARPAAVSTAIFSDGVRSYSVHASASSVSSWVFIALSFSGRFIRMTTTSPCRSRSTRSTGPPSCVLLRGIRHATVTSGRGTSTPTGACPMTSSRRSAASSVSGTPSSPPRISSLCSPRYGARRGAGTVPSRRW